MKTVSVKKYEAEALALLEEVQRSGEEVVVTKRGKPVLRLVPPPSPPARRSHFGRKRRPGLGVKILGDIVNAGEPEWLRSPRHAISTVR